MSPTQNTDCISCEHLIFFKFRGTEAPRALPSNAHTYRLLIFKDPAYLTKRFVRQQRGEIMRYIVQLVNPFDFSAWRFDHLASLRVRRCEGQNYSSALEAPQGRFGRRQRRRDE